MWLGSILTWRPLVVLVLGIFYGKGVLPVRHIMTVKLSEGV